MKTIKKQLMLVDHEVGTDHLVLVGKVARATFRNVYSEKLVEFQTVHTNDKT